MHVLCHEIRQRSQRLKFEVTVAKFCECAVSTFSFSAFLLGTELRFFT